MREAVKLNKLYQSNGEFVVKLPGQVRLFFVGAPFRLSQGLPHSLYRVKTATEQKGFADITIPCEDFGVPTDAAMLQGVEEALRAAFEGRTIFAGCAGGIGRTGTFLSVVLKVLLPQLKGQEMIVKKLREVYLGHAVETPAQRQLIDRIDVRALRRKVRWWWLLAWFRQGLNR